MQGWELADAPRLSGLRACIVIPTYNEVHNAGRILDLIRARASIETHEISVLIVDDSSPDGTADVVRDRMREDPHIHLLLRARREGLGKAYIAGMEYAMARLRPDVIFEMDADLSHDPEDIFRMLEGIEAGADCVIGSRYVEGGTVPAGWGAHRRIVSSCANAATRLLLGVRGVRDCSGGFRAIRVSVLERVRFDRMRVNGYAFQAVLLEEIISLGGKVREIPIAFADRDAGRSKMRVKDLLEGFTAFGRVRLRRMLGARMPRATPLAAGEE